ncbi:hypothetical protein COO60DRAFT_300966 [Scenedesmus sp. NREL 46B-D3]|nr:hypothetical protein COO60DRAFT_300966 [Scenedesmus sp. NREL 46B-D3]
MARSDQLGPGSFRYFISVDFGTHGSGFAYSAASDGYEVKTFQYWPGQRGQPAPKTRTALLYHLSDTSTPLAWGWEAVVQYTDLPEEQRPHFVLLKDFKLHLMPEDFKGLQPLPSGLSVRKLVGDFLRCLMELVNSTLTAHYGSRYRPSMARFCLTVPAGLSQSSMVTMREAALDADIIPTLHSPALMLATEPEAAALIVQQRSHLTGLGSGVRRFMVIDMGGGTVDMTLHKSEAALQGGDLVLTEVTHRECLPEGATCVDARFLEHLAGQLGGDTYADWASDPANAGDLLDFKYMEWEACKCSFGGSNNAAAPVQVSVPYSLVYSADDSTRDELEKEGNRMLLPHDVMASFFKPSLEAIAAKAKDMLARAGGADTVVLVGGFSGSKHAICYLRGKLEAPGRPLVAPAYARSAVLEGGVWYARYPAAIAARCSSMSYGVRAATRWQPGAPSRVWLPHKQGYRCIEGFHQYVAKDELVKAGSSITKSFRPLYPEQTSVVFDIYGSLQKAAKYTTEESMVKIASVRVDIQPGSYKDPDDYALSANFSFGEAQITVRCVDEQTGNEQRAALLFDSSELCREQLADLSI